jgi:ribonucleoside-diphosphate reductase alpha chain
MSRKRLPDCRRSETEAFNRDGICITKTVGCYPSGEVGEVFLNATPTNSMIDALLSDAGIITSIALQYGAPLSEITHALKRDKFGIASSPIGAALDRITIRGAISAKK